MRGNLFIDAKFWTSPGFSCYAGAPTTCSMSEVSGTLTVESRSSSGAEVAVDIELQTNTLERISLVGHVTASDCSAREETICSD